MVTRPRPRSTRLLVVVLLSLSLAVITLDYRQGSEGPLAGLGRSATALMAPLQRAVTAVTEPIGNFFSGLVRLPSLERRNAEQAFEIEELKTRIAQSAFDEEQLAELQRTLELSERLRPESVAASVIANGVSNFQWTVTVGAGADDGIMEGDVVVTGGGEVEGGRLVGVVEQVTDHASQVLLVVDPRARVAAYLNTSHEGGLIAGQGEGDLQMLSVDPAAPVEGDEPVFTQGYSAGGEHGLYPPGILIGQVTRAAKSSDSLEQIVTVRPAVDFSTLDIVLVLKTAEREAGEG